MTNYMNKWIKKAFQKLRDEFGGCCQKCKDTENLEFAHVLDNEFNGRGRGRKERYYNIKNNKQDYILLCESCHSEFDKQSDLLKVQSIIGLHRVTSKN